MLKLHRGEHAQWLGDPLNDFEHSLAHDLTSIQSCRRTPCSTCVTSIPCMSLFSRVIVYGFTIPCRRRCDRHTKVFVQSKFTYHLLSTATYYLLLPTIYHLLPHSTTYYHLYERNQCSERPLKRELNSILTICKINKEAVVTLYALFD